jgi:hypothetical protein
MIVFNLNCSNDHRFEGWFASTAEFERQQQSTLLNCPICGSKEISKMLHAPYVNTGGTQLSATHQPQPQGQPGNEQVANIAREVTKFVEKLIASTDDVGDAFPEEARRIHYNEVPERRIRGHASRDEIKELRDEGIDVIALPVAKHRLGTSH